jgi:DNA-3-methyladenine glycosylase
LAAISLRPKPTWASTTGPPTPYGGRRSQANEGLWRAGGTIYIYSQRQYVFFDVACQEEGNPQGVLIRAIEPAWGLDQMLKNRGGKDGVLLTNGPAKLMQAMGIKSRSWDLAPLADSPFVIDLTREKAAKEIIASPRIGIVQADPASGPRRLCAIMWPATPTFLA